LGVIYAAQTYGAIRRVGFDIGCCEYGLNGWYRVVSHDYILAWRCT
jgi:hypothetical protein